MNEFSEQRREREAIVLERLALARAKLLAANLELRDMRNRKAQRPERALTVSNVGRALLDAPMVTLLGSIMLGSLIVGPKRVVHVVTRAGVSGWITRNLRAVIGR
ncbi:hypothetical protein [Paraburkholderia tropica]|uniref:hypothetical protein n=1 Tax=Paraburkholderia tropica TaxID=92647 RepID=UPI0007ED62E7|nr:hypothetical protein [Paraburkholderia tropica]OBR46606.1 hypothetical protein A6456_29310 [Paraburkholderia tropica]